MKADYNAVTDELTFEDTVEAVPYKLPAPPWWGITLAILILSIPYVIIIGLWYLAMLWIWR